MGNEGLFDATLPYRGLGISREERVRLWERRAEKPSTEEERAAKRLLWYDSNGNSPPMRWDEVDRDWTVLV